MISNFVLKNPKEQPVAFAMDSKFYFQDTLQQQTVAADNKFSFQYTVLTSSQISLGQKISFDPQYWPLSGMIFTGLDGMGGGQYRLGMLASRMN